MARIPKLDAAGKFLAADVNAQIDARAKAATAPLLDGKRGVEATELGTEHLDTVTTPGTYTQSANLEATLESGYPMTRGGVLQVERSVSKTMVWQTYTTYAPSPSTPAQTWQRGSYNGTWTPWSQIGGGSGSGTGSRSVSGTVAFKPEDQALPPFVVATTTGATVEGVTLTAGQMAAFWYLSGAWHVMVHGQDTAWRSTAKPDTRIAVTPAAPTFTNNTTNGGGTWTTTSQAGVRFTPASGTATPGQAVTVTASLSDPTTYKFASGAQTAWTFTFLDPNAPIADTFTGTADTLLAGRATTTGGAIWAGPSTGPQWKLTGDGGIVPTDTTAEAGNNLPLQSNKVDVTVDFAQRAGRFNIVLGREGVGELAVAVMPAGNVALFVGGAVAAELTGNAAGAAGTIRLRFDGTTATAWCNGTQVGSKAWSLTAAHPLRLSNTPANGAGTVRLSNLVITPVK